MANPPVDNIEIIEQFGPHLARSGAYAWIPASSLTKSCRPIVVSAANSAASN